MSLFSCSLFRNGALVALLSVPLTLTTCDALAAPWKCAAISPVGGPLGYQARDAGARCEGLYQPAVGSERIELLNLTNAVKTNSGAKFIQISVAPSLPKDTTLRILGLSFITDTFYRLDAPISSDKALLIPTSDVLEPAALDTSELGYVGYADNTIIPLNVQLLDTSQPRVITASGSVSVIISLSTFATEVLWRWKPTCQREGIDQKWSPVVGSGFYPRTPISFDITNLPSGPCPLMVAINTTSDGWVFTEWTINAAGF
jgi:hypothetical protein